MKHAISSTINKKVSYSAATALYTRATKNLALVSEAEELHATPTEPFDKKWFGGFPTSLENVDFTNWRLVLASENKFKEFYKNDKNQKYLRNRWT